MRTPVLVFPRTRTPSQGRGYLDAGAAGSAEAFGSAIAKGAGSIGAGLTDLATVYQDRTDRVNRFKFLTDYSKFQTQSLVEQDELERTAPLESTDLPAMTTEAHDKRAAEFRKTITDPRLQAEFDAKDASFKGELTLRSVGAQRKKQDMFQTTELDNSYTTWANRVKTDRTLLPQAQQELTEQINATTLPPEDKIKTAHLYGQGLLSASYGNEVEDIRRNSSTQGPPPNYSEGARSITTRLVGAKVDPGDRPLSPEQAAVIAGNMQQESGFRSWAHNAEEGAHGLIQWRLSRWDDLQAAAAVAGKDWRDPDFQINFMLREMKEKYPRAWHKFMTATTMEDMNAAMKQYILYGDDSQGTRLANAKAILAGADPQADLTARDDTAAADMEALNSNPLYDTVPLADRQAMAAAAASQIDEEERERTNQAIEAHDAKLNDLLVGLRDRTKDATDVHEARKTWLQDIDEILKTDQLLADQQTETDEAVAVQETLDNNGQGYNRVTMNGTKDKGVNAWVGKEGLDKITARDDKYMDGELLPAVGKWDDIPTVVVGQLESMASSNDTATAVWALQRLQQMKDIAPNGFVSRTTENRLGERVESFRNLRGLFETDAEMLSYVNGGTTPEAQRVMQARDKDARTNLNKMSSVQFLNKFAPSGWGLPRFLGGYGGSQLSEDFEVSGAYELAGRELYVKNFRIVGNDDDATAMTQRALDERWGLSVIGDSTAKVPMEWPPEKVYAGTKVPMEVYADQIRRAFNLTDDEGYRLISDDTTYKEIGLAGQGQLIGPDGKPRLPSYRVKRITKNGNLVEEGRWFGDPVVPVEEAE